MTNSTLHHYATDKRGCQEVVVTKKSKTKMLDFEFEFEAYTLAESGLKRGSSTILWVYFCCAYGKI